MTTTLQHHQQPLLTKQPLRTIIDSKYGQATLDLSKSIWTAASGNASLCAGFEKLVSAGLMAKNRLPTTYETKLDELVEDARMQIESLNVEELDNTIVGKIEEAKTTLKNFQEKTITYIDDPTSKVVKVIDHSLAANKVVDVTSSVVDFCLPPEDDESFEDAVSEDDQPAIEDVAKEQFALKKAQKLSKSVLGRVSKKMQKQWHSVSQQLHQIQARSEEVKASITSNGVNLIDYSKSLPKDLYESLPGGGIPAIASKGKEITVTQMRRIGELSVVQLDRIAPTVNPYLSPMTPILVRLMNVGAPFGVKVDEQMLRKQDWFKKFFMNPLEAPPPTTHQVPLVDAKVESKKKIEIKKGIKGTKRGNKKRTKKGNNAEKHEVESSGASADADVDSVEEE